MVGIPYSDLIDAVFAFQKEAIEEIANLEGLEHARLISDSGPYQGCLRAIRKASSRLETKLGKEQYANLESGVDRVAEKISRHEHIKARRELQDACAKALKDSLTAS